MKTLRYKILFKSNYCKTFFLYLLYIIYCKTLICHLEREDWEMKYPSINQVQELENKRYIRHVFIARRITIGSNLIRGKLNLTWITTKD